MSRSARRLVLAVVVAILAVGIAAAVVALTGGGVTVPDVTGLTRTAAIEALEAAGLEVGEVSETPDAEVAAGLVLRQDPTSGSEVDEGAQVALTLSSGPGMAAVPDEQVCTCGTGQTL